MYSLSKAYTFRLARYGGFKYNQTNPNGGYVVTKGDMVIVHVTKGPIS